MDHRALARMTAAGRVAVGVALLAVPTLVTRTWIGPAGREPGAKLLARGFGGRDLVLGLGVIAALERGDPHAGDWVRASALSDTGDAVATVLAFRHLPRRGRLIALAAASGAAVVGFLAAENLD